MNKFAIAAAVSMFTAPAMADGHASGDAAAGEKSWSKCKSCHMIEAADGTSIQKGGRTGPNLYGITTRAVGQQEGFKYSKGLLAGGEQGLAMDEALFIAYVADTNAWLKENVGEDAGRSKMTYRLKDAEEAANIWAYLASVAPEGDS